MKNNKLISRISHCALLISAGAVLLSCSYNQVSGTMAGASLGGVFGSAIGGLIGGPRGADAGTAIGMLAGGAAGAAATAPREPNRGHNHQQSYDDVQYGSYRPDNHHYATPASPLKFLEVTKVRFMDENNNRSLDANERAWLEMEIHNRGNHTVCNVAPVVECDNKRVLLSPTAIVGSLAPGQGVRYRAAVVGKSNLRSGTATFKVSFGTGKDKVTAKTFRINTRR